MCDAGRMFVAGNWKMNLDLASALALTGELKAQVGQEEALRVGLFPPFVYLKPVVEAAAGSNLIVGAQNMCAEPKGAFTGEVSATMLCDIGCTHVILGHSERRHVYGESEGLINDKVHRALDSGLAVILCVGEKIEERKAETTARVVARQVKAGLTGVSAEQMHEVTIAYEPVWAIGTGETASPEQAQEVHALVRSLVAELYSGTIAEHMAIQYGGSVKPDNAAELLSMCDVDGALVGGAALKADTFVPIVEAGRAAGADCGCSQ